MSRKRATKPQVGRPLKEAGKPRTDVIFIRVDPVRKTTYERAADATGVSMTDWILNSCDNTALRMRKLAL